MTGRRHHLRGLMLLVAATAAVVLAVLAGSLGKSATFDPVAVLGKPAPAEHLPLLNGATLSIDQLRGKAVLVNFWNTWCQPCQQEAPALATFYAQHADDSDFAMVGIVHDDTKTEVSRWVDARGIPWSIAFDPGSRAALDFGTTGQPETYAIAPDGTIVGKRAGPATVEDLTRLLAMARGPA